MTMESRQSYCEPPVARIGLVCVLPPSLAQPCVGELLAPLVDNGSLIPVAIPTLTREGLRWRRVEAPRRDVVEVK